MGKMGLINVTKDLKAMLDVFRTGELFVIFDSEEAAIKKLS